jgi:Zn-dependent protease with chaperone function/uncharacterized tellurite resistance protein B-like protein
MDFFQRQDQARRSSLLLVVFFALAVLGTVVAVNAIVYGVINLFGPSDIERIERYSHLRDVGRSYPEPLIVPGGDPRDNPGIYLFATLGTLLLISGGSAYKAMALSAGGPAVAEMVGGTLITPESSDPQHRKILNIVEEMAIASGVPVPQVYLLEGERGINAFAAGKRFEDAVIGVTEGAVEKLSRDELQGVVAHEFSHILNGDMRLNIRLMAWIHGILLLALIGYTLLRSSGRARVASSRDSGKGVVVVLVLAIGLLVVGYIGMFFARLIQAAVSRQREYLADASAVQFTRNPHGIAGALRKIGGSVLGSNVGNANALEVQHMFFGSAVSLSLTSLLATHPPLDKRIRAIDPTWDGSFVRPPEAPAYEQRAAARGDNLQTWLPGGEAAVGGLSGFSVANAGRAGRGRRVRMDAAGVASSAAQTRPAHVTYAGTLLTSLPEELKEASRNSFSARAMVCALLLADEQGVRDPQFRTLEGGDEPLLRETLRLEPVVRTLGTESRLPLIDLVIPTLRQLSPKQRQDYREVLRKMILADQRITTFEYVVYRVLGKTLQLTRPAPPAYHAIQPLADDATRVIASVSRHSADRREEAVAVGLQRLGVSPNAVILANPGDLKQFDLSLDRLAAAAPGVKRRFIDALAHAIAVDGQMSIEEAEMLRAIATVLEVPLPPFVDVF